MPDASDPRGRGPLDWGDAFAALPQETPPAGGFERVAARLDARRPARAAGWLGAATAAALALVIAWPRHDASPVFPKPREAAPPVVAVAPPPSTAAPTRPGGGDALAASGRKPADEAAAIALPKAVEAARKPRYAARDASPRKATSRTTDTAASPAPRDDGSADGGGQLDALYAESARLEALLALARDERVASAGAALLASELEAQVAVIDAHLAQPGLGEAQRAALWQARVDALRQAAGFESTQRVLAARGDGAALLVSVD